MNSIVLKKLFFIATLILTILSFGVTAGYAKHMYVPPTPLEEKSFEYIFLSSPSNFYLNHEFAKLMSIGFDLEDQSGNEFFNTLKKITTSTGGVKRIAVLRSNMKNNFFPGKRYDLFSTWFIANHLLREPLEDRKKLPLEVEQYLKTIRDAHAASVSSTSASAMDDRKNEAEFDKALSASLEGIPFDDELKKKESFEKLQSYFAYTARVWATYFETDIINGKLGDEQSTHKLEEKLINQKSDVEKYIAGRCSSKKFKISDLGK
jgi:hypothetical protein